MSRFTSWFLATAVAFTVLACAGAPKPEARLVSSESAIRGAEEAGAGTNPQATLHLKLAQEQREQAVELIKHDENHRASMLLARAEADAELAVALSRQAAAQADAAHAQESVQTLKNKDAQ